MVFLLTVFWVVLPRPGSGQTLHSMGTVPSLYELNAADGTVVATTTVVVAGAVVVGGNGLAADPLTGELWGLLRLLGQAGRELVTIDPATGDATRIGDTGDLFAALAFDDTGRLFGISGLGAIPGGILYEVNRNDASVDSLFPLTNAGGHALAFNPDDGLFYHATGGFFESIDVTSATLTPIPVAGHPWFAAKALAYEGESRFAFVSDFGDYLKIDVAGVTEVSGTTASCKGLAFVDNASGVPDLLTRSKVRLDVWPTPYRGGLLRLELRSGGDASRTVRRRESSGAPASGALSIHDASGALVRWLDATASATGGVQATTWWDGRDSQGRRVPEGLYWARGSTGLESASARIVVLR